MHIWLKDYSSYFFENKEERINGALNRTMFENFLQMIGAIAHTVRMDGLPRRNFW